MVKLSNSIEIEYSGNKYTVIDFIFKNKKVPILLDSFVFKQIKSFDKSWFINDKGFVVCLHNNKEINMHDIVMKLYEKEKYKLKPIIHLNKLGIDNRYENLIYDEVNKETQKNLRKKTRTVDLINYDIIADNIPTYIWFLKRDKSHGPRFVVEVGDISWKTTSSEKLSLKYKLEEAKKYLRYLKEIRKDLFDDFSMNGDFNKYGINMLNSFYDIISKAGDYKHIKKINPLGKTDKILEENTDGLTLIEKYMLSSFSPKENKWGNPKEIYDEFETKINDILPEFCYYYSDPINGDYFYVKNPNYNKIFYTTKDKNVSINDKLIELKQILNKLK
jgi:hypothetical protein